MPSVKEVLSQLFSPQNLMQAVGQTINPQGFQQAQAHKFDLQKLAEEHALRKRQLDAEDQRHQDTMKIERDRLNDSVEARKFAQDLETKRNAREDEKLVAEKDLREAESNRQGFDLIAHGLAKPVNPGPMQIGPGGVQPTNPLPPGATTFGNQMLAPTSPEERAQSNLSQELKNREAIYQADQAHTLNFFKAHPEIEQQYPGVTAKAEFHSALGFDIPTPNPTYLHGLALQDAFSDDPKIRARGMKQLNIMQQDVQADKVKPPTSNAAQTAKSIIQGRAQTHLANAYQWLSQNKKITLDQAKQSSPQDIDQALQVVGSTDPEGVAEARKIHSSKTLNPIQQILMKALQQPSQTQEGPDTN